MASHLETLRGLVHTAITTDKAAVNYAINEFVLEQKYDRQWDLEDSLDNSLPPNGAVTVLGLGSGPYNIRTRGTSKVAVKEIPIRVIIMRDIGDTGDTSLIDDLIELKEQLEETCRKDVDADDNGYSIMRIEPMVDEEGDPMSHALLRKSIFYAHFDAVYNVVLS